MIDADYVDDLVIFANTPAQHKSQHEQPAGSIGLYMNTNKTAFMCLKQEGTISTKVASL